MMKKVFLALALGSALIPVQALPAYAQTTEQTDKSEEDWRKSKKKPSNSGEEIFDKIFNTNNGGWGTAPGPTSPVDSLPEESRRHVMKERARVIAETNPGEMPDDTYNPSEAAKSDPALEQQEKEAWDVIMTDMKGGSGSGQPGDGPNKVAIAGKGGSGTSPNGSVMRGGSTASVEEILAQIKGMKPEAGGGNGTQPAGTSGGSGTNTGSPLGQNPLGQGSTGQSSTGQAPSGQSPDGQSGTTGTSPSGQSASGSGQSGQNSGMADSQSQNQGQDSGNGQSQSGGQASAQGQDGAQNGSGSADGQSGAAGQTGATGNPGQNGGAQNPSAQSPLDRVKAASPTGSTGGNQSSAADYIKRKTGDQ